MAHGRGISAAHGWPADPRTCCLGKDLSTAPIPSVRVSFLWVLWGWGSWPGWGSLQGTPGATTQGQKAESTAPPPPPPPPSPSRVDKHSRKQPLPLLLHLLCRQCGGLAVGSFAFPAPACLRELPSSPHHGELASGHLRGTSCSAGTGHDAQPVTAGFNTTAAISEPRPPVPAIFYSPSLFGCARSARLLSRTCWVLAQRSFY